MVFIFSGIKATRRCSSSRPTASSPLTRSAKRRTAAAAYIAEIEKITQAPIKYVVYSHSHFDHIAGGKPFKDLGAVFVAHKNTAKSAPLRGA